MFREVTLPTTAAGRLLLHSMPGRREALDVAWAEAKRQKVSAIVRLTGFEEVRSKSPSYAAALEASQVPFQVLPCEVPDYGVPADPGEFWSLARDVASRVRSGEVILIHCGAGIGRTGTFAACVLVGLGLSVALAKEAVSHAGSGAETQAQAALITWCVSQASTHG